MLRTVLVVDDDTDFRETVSDALIGAGYRVVGAAHGADGLMRLATMPGLPCLVLLDLTMPVMSGWEFLAALARHSVRPPVIAMTSSTMDDVPAGAVAVL